MKMLSMMVVILGVISMIMSIVIKLLGQNIAHVSPSGWLQGATAMYLLALALMMYDKVYGAKPQP